jgi:hypothetical protein
MFYCDEVYYYKKCLTKKSKFGKIFALYIKNIKYSHRISVWIPNMKDMYEC